MIRDAHMKPEPILVITSLIFAVPSYIAFKQNKIYDCLTCLSLMCTSIGFHKLRTQTLFIVDFIAVCHFSVRIWYLSHLMEMYLVYYISVFYSVISFYVGHKYKIMSYDPNWNIQMFYHALIHFLTAYSYYIVLTPCVSCALSSPGEILNT